MVDGDDLRGLVLHRLQAGEDDQGHIVYNTSLLALAKHYRFQPRACRPYRAKTKGKVERPFAF